MDIRDFRTRVQRATGPDDDFMCLCPAHADKNGSLHVTQGTKKILLKCFAGCDQSAILRAMGLTEDDLWLEPARKPDENKHTSQPAAAGSSPRGEPRKEKYPVKEMFAVGGTWWNAKQKRAEPIVAVYDYADESGEVIVRVARTEMIEGGRKEKNFPVHYRNPADGKWYFGKGPRKDLLYKLPEMLKEKADGKTIYIVEGEKDVNNARALGLCAVCNIGGGAKTGAAGKWPIGCTQAIAGAQRVVLIPDNDEAGEGLMRYVAHELCGKVGELKLIRLRDALKELPEHGDLTDYAKMVGNKGAVLASITQLEAAAQPLTQDDVAAMSSAAAGSSKKSSDGGGDDGDEDDGEDYYGLKEYCIKYGCLYKRTGNGARRLCTFVPHPQEVVIHDDGDELYADYIIGATARDGRTLPPATVHGEEEFLAMKWPVRAWQLDGNLSPRSGAKEEVRSAIMSAGAKVAKKRMVYAHTGWRDFSGKWAYLYHGGAIGIDGVSVELRGVMNQYTLDTPEESSMIEGVMADIKLLGRIPARIIFPMLAQAYLAPLYSALEAIHDPPIYVIYLAGQSQSFKSTIAGYVAAHFGEFYQLQMPATFQDTANSVRDKAFEAKDALYVVDDYIASANPRQRALMDGVADAMISAVADRAARGRLGPDKKQQAVRPARCTCIMTGEQLPGVSESRKGRLYLINVGKGEIAKDVKDLDDLAEACEDGRYRAAMRGYIDALCHHYGELPNSLRILLRKLKEEAGRRLTRKEGRWIKMTTHLMLGVEMMLNYFFEAGAIDEGNAKALREIGWEAIIENVEMQGQELDEISPENTYIGAIRSLLASGAVGVADLDKPVPGAYYQNKVGWRDAEFYYFIPDQIGAAARELLKKQDNSIGLSAQQLHRQMAAKGLCCADNRGTPLRVKSVEGRAMRLLWIPRNVIDGTHAEVAGMRMEVMSEQMDMELPERFKEEK